MKPESNTPRLYDISIDRTGKESVKISWKTRQKNDDFFIYSGESPDSIDRKRPLTQIKGETAVAICGLDPDSPHYFEIVPKGSQGIIISERRVPLEGAVNFRDLGGYQTVDGRRLKWGKVFRSDHLSRLTDRDVALLERMGIKLVCDFRTSSEAKRRPDKFPGDGPAEYLHLPIKHGEFEPTNAFDRIKKGDLSWLTKDFLISGYIINIDEFAHVWGQVFTRLGDRNQTPLVFHCTGGKDRAGTCAALILLALGVPEETVFFDHGLSNIYIADVLNGLYERIRSFGIDIEKIEPYFTAPRYCIEAMLNHIREKYGTAADYLKSKAGVSEHILKQIKAELLE
jgi:protein-tyrosine phosphatase